MIQVFGEAIGHGIGTTLLEGFAGRVEGVLTRAGSAGPLQPSAVSLDAHIKQELWRFPSNEITLADDTVICHVNTAELIVYARDWGDGGASLCAQSLTAFVETKGWGVQGLEIDVFYWATNGQLLDSWQVRGLDLSVSSEQSVVQLGAMDLLSPAVHQQIAATTYSIGGGWWYELESGANA